MCWKIPRLSPQRMELSWVYSPHLGSIVVFDLACVLMARPNNVNPASHGEPPLA